MSTGMKPEHWPSPKQSSSTHFHQSEVQVLASTGGKKSWIFISTIVKEEYLSPPKWTSSFTSSDARFTHLQKNEARVLISSRVTPSTHLLPKPSTASTEWSLSTPLPEGSPVTYLHQKESIVLISVRVKPENSPPLAWPPSTHLHQSEARIFGHQARQLVCVRATAMIMKPCPHWKVSGERKKRRAVTNYNCSLPRQSSGVVVPHVFRINLDTKHFSHFFDLKGQCH